VVRIGDREVVFGLLLPGVAPDGPAVRRMLEGWPGSHWASPAGDAWEIALEVRTRPPRRERWLLHAVLLLAALFSATVSGALIAGHDPLGLAERVVLGVALPVPTRLYAAALLPGLLFSIPLMGVLLGHEMGHYVAARRHNLDASPPYFIPAPFIISLIGTLGAFIRLRSPMLHRRMLMDVGAAGPLAGLVLALPVAAVGIALSRPAALLPGLPGRNLFPFLGVPLQLGDSLLWMALRAVFAPGAEVLILHPMAVAGWVGLFFTAMNLLPVAQLDGGHIVYALLGARRQLAVATLFFASLLVQGWWWPGWWFWAVLILLIGRGRLSHPPVLDPRLPLTRRQRVAGWACVVFFVLAFVPAPVS
jgi:membrane-associated protease RseP (regulator of RpoE activity)